MPEASSSLTILNVCMVKPSSPTAHQIAFLADVDILFINFHPSRRIIFYKLPDHVVWDYTSLVHSLKSSLSLALVHYYPWAGRLCIGPDDRLSLDCNDAGVKFVEAFTSIPFANLEANDFQFTPFFNQLVPQHDDHAFSKPDYLADLPVLSVQVTRFLQGGLAIGFFQSHVIADGLSFWNFAKAWTESNRGMPISSSPVHMRTVLARENLIPSSEVGRPSCRLSDPEVPPDDLVHRTFHFSSDMIQNLKSIACKHGGGRLTSFEVLCAHLWRQVVEAQAETTDTQTVALMIPVDARRRLIPPLPANYFGNVVILGGVYAQARDLKEETLWTTATRIHESITSWGDKHCRLRLASTEHELDKVTNDMGSVLMVGGSTKFNVYETDFGWGKPVAVKFLRFQNGFMSLQCGRGEGCVDVSLSLSRGCMDALLHVTRVHDPSIPGKMSSMSP